MFRVLQLNIEVDVVTSSTFYLEGNSCENLIVMYLSTEIGFLTGWLNMSRAVNQNTLTFDSHAIRLFTVKPRQICVPAYVQKVIFGSYIRFGMYEKIFSKIKIKMTGPTGNNEDCFPLPRNGKKKNTYNLMGVTVHLSLFCFIRLLLLFAH